VPHSIEGRIVDDLLSEKEQIEQIRTWWSEYGNYVIGGIVAGALGLFGFNYYQTSKMNARLAASTLYESLTGHVVDGDLEEAEAVASEIAADYGSTSYDAQAKLAMARLYMDKNRDQDAADVLQALLASDAGEEVKHVARVRLARVLLYQGKAEDVVSLLEGQDNAAFAPLYNELLGDAYQALGRIEDAEAAYRSVLIDPLSQATVDQQLVQWKALDLPQTMPEAAVVDPVDSPVQEPAEEPAVEAAETPAEGTE